MKITYEDLEFNEDYSSERAEELGLFQLKLELPKELEVHGIDFGNRILIKKEIKQDIRKPRLPSTRRKKK